MALYLSLLAMYNHSHGLFSEMQVPQNVSRETLVNSILMECGEFKVIYTDPVIMRVFIKTWSQRNIMRWQKLVDTTHYTYNPINNYDRTEKEVVRNNNYNLEGRAVNTVTTVDRTAARTENDGFTEIKNGESGEHTLSTRTPNLSDKTSYNTREVYENIQDASNGENRHYRSGYNAQTQVEVSRDTADNTNVRTGATARIGDDTLKRTGTETIETDVNGTAREETDNERVVHGESEGNEKTKGGTRELIDRAENAYNTREVITFGNIGVTTTQKMITEEREVVDFDIISVIITDFKKSFCVMTY